MSTVLQLVRTLQTPLILVAAVWLLSVLIFGRTPVIDQALLFGLITMVVVVGLYVFVGTSGVVSFGQISFMAIGAYVTGMLTMPEVAKPVIIPNAPKVFLDTTVSTPVGVLIGAACAAVVALLVSIPLMRLSGLAASIATLSVLLIVYTFFQNWQIGTSGSGNLTRIPRDLNAMQVLPWAIAAILVAWAYSASRFGMQLRASREDHQAARSIGVNIHAERRIAFVVSAGIVGAAGGLFSHALGSISATDFYLATTFSSLAMLVVGGMTTLSGAVIGVSLLSTVSFVFEQWQNDNAVMGVALSVPSGTRDVVFAAVLLLVLLLKPEGLAAGRDVTFPRRRNSQSNETIAKSASAGGDAEIAEPTAETVSRRPGGHPRR
jgi:branched-chain amino acid transport system permease protein